MLRIARHRVTKIVNARTFKVLEDVEEEFTKVMWGVVDHLGGIHGSNLRQILVNMERNKQKDYSHTNRKRLSTKFFRNWSRYPTVPEKFKFLKHLPCKKKTSDITAGEYMDWEKLVDGIYGEDWYPEYRMGEPFEFTTREPSKSRGLTKGEKGWEVPILVEIPRKVGHPLVENKLCEICKVRAVDQKSTVCEVCSTPDVEDIFKDLKGYKFRGIPRRENYEN